MGSISVGFFLWLLICRGRSGNKTFRRNNINSPQRPFWIVKNRRTPFSIRRNILSEASFPLGFFSTEPPSSVSPPTIYDAPFPSFLEQELKKGRKLENRLTNIVCPLWRRFKQGPHTTFSNSDCKLVLPSNNNISKTAELAVKAEEYSVEQRLCSNICSSPFFFYFLLFFSLDVLPFGLAEGWPN